MISALVMVFLLVVLIVDRDRRGPLAALVGLCALQAVIISLGQHYGIDAFRAVQPVTAAFIPPLAWVAFRMTAVRHVLRARDTFHLLGPLLVLLCALHVPAALDFLVPMAFLGYGTALLLAAWSGADGMPGARLETGDFWGRIWRLIAAALLVSAFFDGAVAVTLVAGLPHWQPWLVSIGFACILLMLGAHALSYGMVNGSRWKSGAGLKGRPVQDADPGFDAEVVARLDRLLADRKLYLDPDLTLGRLSRRLGVPVKQLSAAINRSTGENVSRYVNGFRIEKACERLRAGDTVTAAMESSGFNTRSNFNREFRRLTGQSPSAWREAAGMGSSLRSSNDGSGRGRSPLTAMRSTET